jgi:hypothetical protein
VPRLEKTASAAIAAAVVAVAATVTSLASSPAPDDAVRSPAARASTSPAASATRPGAAAPLSAASAVGPPRTVLYLGRSPELKPRGGVAKSFPCRAASSLRWACVVRQGPAPVVPAGLTPDVVVVVLVADDDAQRVAKLLDRLPPGAETAPLVLLAPATSDGRAARRTADLRQLTASRGGTFVDPVPAGWFAGPKGAAAFVRGGQLNPAGRVRCTERLASALGDLVVR